MKILEAGKSSLPILIGIDKTFDKLIEKELKKE